MEAEDTSKWGPLEWKNKGNAHFSAQEYDKAIACYSSAIELEPTNAVHFSNRSAAYTKIEDYSRAKLDANMAIDLDPKWPKGWWRKGTAEIEAQEYHNAIKTFEAGLEYSPTDKNLVDGKKKAVAMAAALDSVIGSVYGNEEFDIDGPSRKAPKTEEKQQATSPPAGEATAVDSSSNSKKNEATRAAETTQENKDDVTVEVAENEEWPGSPEDEIKRIQNAPNYYAVLHVNRDATNAQIKKNYYTLARLLHPDKCQLPGAAEAMTQVSMANDTLTSAIKKKLYDQYVTDTGESSENRTYAEWEAQQNQVELPKWLDCLLKVKGCGCLLLILILIITLPIFLIIFVIVLILWLLCLPYNIILMCCFPEKYARMKERAEKDRAKMEEDVQDARFQHV